MPSIRFADALAPLAASAVRGRLAPAVPALLLLPAAPGANPASTLRSEALEVTRGAATRTKAEPERDADGAAVIAGARA